jgi:hypothetical protein
VAAMINRVSAARSQCFLIDIVGSIRTPTDPV